jgi:DNA-3-methyladenine glycosylase I
MTATLSAPTLPASICRCAWPGSDPLYCAYHDTEWGVPERDDRALWEKLILDGFQAGLSWITILRKREAFREAFEGFHPETIARWGEAETERLLGNAGIIRSRAKIAATIGNARAYLAMQDKGEVFSDFIWSFTGGEPVHNAWTEMKQVPAQTPMAVEMSKALKARGFKFCGPVIVYAYCQAIGVVNDHVTGCFRWEEVKRLA